MKSSYHPAIPLPGIHSEEIKIEKDSHIPAFTAALFTIVRTWQQARCPSNRQVDKEAVVHIHSVILLSHKKEHI